MWQLKTEEFIGSEEELDADFVDNSLDYLNYSPFKGEVKEGLPLLEMAETVTKAAEEVAIKYDNYDTVECFLVLVDLMLVD